MFAINETERFIGKSIASLTPLAGGDTEHDASIYIDCIYCRRLETVFKNNYATVGA